MTEHDAQLRHVLLDLVSTTRSVSASRFTALTDADWRVVLKMAKQHRIGPMLYQRVRASQLHNTLPTEVVEQWAAAYRKAALRYLSFRKTLARLNTVLTGRGIEFAALKGAWLAQHAYTDPALRPLRDIDILVRPERALETYALLEQNGFARGAQYPMPLGDAVFDTKHLPPMRSAETGIQIEVHHRLLSAPAALGASCPLNDVSNLLSRREFQDGIAYLSPTDAFLHLIVHAAYDHQFNNGPLTFYDIAILLEKAPVDWPKFWRMAAAGNWVPGCVLILELASFYHGADLWRQSCDISLPRPSQSELESAALLSLQDFDLRGEIGLRAAIATDAGWAAKTRRILRRSFPPLHHLAAFAGSPDASYRSALHYPRWLIYQINRLIVKPTNLNTQSDVQRAAEVRNWLGLDAA